MALFQLLTLFDWLMFFLITLGLALLFTLTIAWATRQYRVQYLLKNPDEAQGVYGSILTSFSFLSSEEIAKKFIRAGFYNFPYAHLYLPAKVVFLCLIGLALWFLGSEKMAINFLVFMFAMVLIIIVPDIYLEKRASALKDKTSANLSYLLDLMAICVKTGMTIESSMSYLSKEVADFDADLGYLLQITVRRAKVAGMETALDELHARVPSSEMRSFVNTLNQSLKFGTSIYDVLTHLSQDIREIQMLKLEEKVGSLSAKMSLPLVLFIMFPIVILIVAPGIMRLML